MEWALANCHIIFTHNLDFGTTLALTRATGPSVLQIRGQNVLPDHMEKVVIGALQQHDTDLAAGALVVVDEAKRRVRILPIT
jgi:predicted nuclease of predicted toxin-antitoxin system